MIRNEKDKEKKYIKENVVPFCIGQDKRKDYINTLCYNHVIHRTGPNRPNPVQLQPHATEIAHRDLCFISHDERPCEERISFHFHELFLLLLLRSWFKGDRWRLGHPSSLFFLRSSRRRSSSPLLRCSRWKSRLAILLLHRSWLRAWLPSSTSSPCLLLRL